MTRAKQMKATKRVRKKAGHQTAGQEAVPTAPLANEKLKEDSPKVITAVLENALNGNMNCTRLLVGMSGRTGQMKPDNETPAGVSLAQMWSAEPEWEGESNEAMAETTPGGRETEA